MRSGYELMSLTVFAFGCHPDDIEFLMSGTLFLLREARAEIHYMNPANGCLGTTEYGLEEITAMRRSEGKDAAAYLGARYHESIVNDIEVLYTTGLLRKVAAKVREIQPDVMLLLSLEDYMEDHMNASKLGSTAAFCRGMPNFITDPDRPPYSKDVAVYHAMPIGLEYMTSKRPEPDFFINIERVIDKKEKMLSIHKSQKNWLDESQGINSYLENMKNIGKDAGAMSTVFLYAEGWRKHNHLGFCREHARPLENTLQDYVHYSMEKGG
jgi:N-acetylglucosamine malate deacetylase 1